MKHNRDINEVQDAFTRDSGSQDREIDLKTLQHINPQFPEDLRLYLKRNIDYYSLYLREILILIVFKEVDVDILAYNFL